MKVIQPTPPLRRPGYNGLPDNTDSSLIPGKINWRRLTEINSRYYGLSLMRTLTRVPTVSAVKEVDCIWPNCISFLWIRIWLRIWIEGCRGWAKWYDWYTSRATRELHRLHLTIYDTWNLVGKSFRLGRGAWVLCDYDHRKSDMRLISDIC